MGFSLPFGKKRKMRKLIRNYIKDRVREKRAFNEQMKRIDAMLEDEQIDQKIHERLRLLGILETQYYLKQEEEWAKIEKKFQNPFSS
jgi:hypothetical protein